MQWIRQNLRLLICCTCTLLLGGGMGFWLSRQFTADPNPENIDSQPVGQIGQPSILPNTSVHTTYHFLLCGHTCEKEEAGGALVGCTLDDIAALYQDARVTSFNSSQTVIERELEQLCPQHYLLVKKDESTLSIYCTDKETLENTLLMDIPIEMDHIHADVRSLLEEGLVFDSIESINTYLEDIES